MKITPEKKKLFYQIMYDLFISSFVFYLILIWIDRARKGYVSRYFDPNIILALLLISGFLTVLYRVRKRKEQQ